jgi:nucleolar protein 56
MVFCILFESAAGYALFEVKDAEEISALADKVQKSLGEFKRVSKILSLKAFRPFSSAEIGLENINDVSEGILNSFLRDFLESSLGKKKDVKLGVAEGNLKTAIESALGISCIKDSTVQELTRAIRLHFSTFLQSMKDEEGKEDDNFLFTAERGLAHSFGRAKIKFNVNRADNMIIQSISMLDQLDKDVNTFAMRLREWYSWHFPELIKIVNDNILYARCALAIGNREQIDENEVSPKLNEILGDEEKVRLVLAAAKSSMGYTISEFDLKSLTRFAERVVHLTEFRESLQDYLHDKMTDIAPNLSALIGDVVGARLINHAGSLTTLAKYPASTIQILGAEKALFRALKTKGNTPKYGLIFNSSFIGRAKTKDKGRISRYLANKAAIAARIDAFADSPSTKFGEVMKQQVEDRLRFYEEGVAPEKNIDVMKRALAEIGGTDLEDGGGTKESKKRKRGAGDDESSPKKDKEKKKKSKEPSSDSSSSSEEEKNKKKKKHKKQKTE